MRKNSKKYATSDKAGGDVGKSTSSAPAAADEDDWAFAGVYL